MALTIRVAHDFTCPWCYIGVFQALSLRDEFGATLDWVGHELWPESLELPPKTETPVVATNRPVVPTRLELAYAAQGLAKPTVPKITGPRIHNALEAAEYAASQGKADEFIELVYRAIWEQGLDGNDPETLVSLGQAVGLDGDGLREAIATKAFADNIVAFDDDSYAVGVYNVPTFFIGGERYAEQPLVTLRKAAAEALGGQK